MAIDSDAAERNRRSRHADFLESANSGDIEKLRRFLADRTIDVNYAEPVTGLTALHIAAARNAGAALRLLVATGRCDYAAKDAKGRTAATLAVTVGRNPATGRYLFDLQHLSGVAIARQRGGAAESTDSG